MALGALVKFLAPDQKLEKKKHTEGSVFFEKNSLFLSFSGFGGWPGFRLGIALGALVEFLSSPSAAEHSWYKARFSGQIFFAGCRMGEGSCWQRGGDALEGALC